MNSYNFFHENHASKKHFITKLVLYLLILIFSIIIGPLITILIYLGFLALLEKGLTVSTTIDGTLLAYYTIFISISMFMLVWYSFYILKKKITISETFTHKTWHKIALYQLKKDNVDLDLPEIAYKGLKSNSLLIEKSIPKIGFFILLTFIFSLISLILVVFGLFNPIERKNILGDTSRWFIQISIFLALFLICALISIWLFYKNIFLQYIVQYNYKMFWYGYFASILVSYNDFNGNFDNINVVIDKFKKKFPEHYKNLTDNKSSNLEPEFLSFLTEKLIMFDNMKIYFLPQSFIRISQYYVYLTIIAGFLADKLIVPVSSIMNAVVKMLL